MRYPLSMMLVNLDHMSVAEITLSSEAAAKIKTLSTSLPEAKGKFLRVVVKGGGCSGYMYDFKFDHKKANDQVIEKEGASCLVDPQSAALLRGSQIDYVDGLTGAGFIVKNPNATGSCGCGSSFSM